jgi:hypothetical protein
MRRTTTTDGGSRYLVSLPFAREVPEDQRAGLREALEAAAFNHRHEYGQDPISTANVTVTDTEARVTVRLPFGDDYVPGDVVGRLARAVRAWSSREGPLATATLAGGDQSIASLDAAALDVDREPAGDGPHTYLLAYPERPLTDEECSLLEAVTDADAVVSPAFVALVGATSPVYDSPAARVLRDLRDDLAGHVPADHELRERGFFESREVGTLALVDEAGREALAERGRAQSPHSTPDDTEADSSEVNA